MQLVNESVKIILHPMKESTSLFSGSRGGFRGGVLEVYNTVYHVVH